MTILIKYASINLLFALVCFQTKQQILIQFLSIDICDSRGMFIFVQHFTPSEIRVESLMYYNLIIILAMMQKRLNKPSYYRSPWRILALFALEMSMVVSHIGLYINNTLKMIFSNLQLIVVILHNRFKYFQTE